MLTLRLFDVRHPTQTQIIELSPSQEDYLIGVTPECTICLTESRLTGIQGKIKNLEGQYYFYPQSEQLYFNEVPAQEPAYPLASDDTIRLAEFVLIVDTVPQKNTDNSRPLAKLKTRLQQKKSPTNPPSSSD